MLLQQDTLFDNRYLLKKLLGSGGFSEVWLVEDTKVSYKKMALKVYAPGKGLDDDGVQLFSNEFELVFDLNHANLLRPSHFDVCERSPYLLMPYCEQGSVNKFAGRFAEEDAWRFMHDVAAGLAYLHEQEPPIIHQDIKSDNVLKDQSGRYLITDFGISAKSRSTLRKSMSSVKLGGTMAYMPPERFSKENIPIKASDIWAIGATVYELLTGHLPFGEHGGLMQKSGAETPDLSGNFSKELQEVVCRCLLKDPWNRPVAQQIVEWAKRRLKGEKNVFQTKKEKPRISKIMFGIGSGVALLLLAFVIVRYVFQSKKTDKPVSIHSVVVEDKPTEPIVSGPNPTDSNPTDSTNSLISPISPASVIPTEVEESVIPISPAPWLTEYDRILTIAQSAYNRRDYVRAKEEYNRALNLANRNGDRNKAAFATGQIVACDRAIETARMAEEAKQKEIRERLATYNFVGNYPLGTRYMIVQNKSNYRWGIINPEGYVAETFNYTQVSSRLRNGYYALKNDRGWVVFDSSLNKVATDRENLDDYK